MADDLEQLSKRELVGLVRRLLGRIDRLEARVAALEQENAQLKQENARLTQEVARLKKDVIGRLRTSQGWALQNRPVEPLGVVPHWAGVSQGVSSLAGAV